MSTQNPDMPRTAALPHGSAPAAGSAPRRGKRLIRFDQIIMGGAVLSLLVLILLPLVSLFVGSVTSDEGVTIGHFQEALSGRLYVSALWNSLVLGAWTGLF